MKIRIGFSWFHAWASISLLAIIYLAIFGIRIALSPESIQVQYISDDAFYYLVLARNFINTGLWTFDSGNSLTSGFHPLWAYLLSFIYAAFRPNPSEFIRYGVIFTALITLSTILLVWIIAVRRKQTIWLLILALIVTSKNFTYNSVSIMEWPLVILFGTLYLLYNFHAWGRKRMFDACILFSLGFAGSISRTDFGLVPLSLLVASLLSRNRAAIWNLLAGLVGASTGLIITLVHSYITSGQFFQSSAMIKAYWLTAAGGSILDPLFLALYTVGFGTNYSSILFLLLSIFFIFLLRKFWSVTQFSIEMTTPDRVAFVSANICIAGYVLLYSRLRPIQEWYTANLTAPSFALLFVTLTYLYKDVNKKYIIFIKSAGSTIVMSLVLAHTIGTFPVSSTNSIWPHQQFLREAGIYLNQNPLDGKVGAWNAGIVGYYQGGHVVNLDGLVNNDVYDYVTMNNLPAYLTAKRITHIVDFENIFYPIVRRAGGYDNTEFLERLHPIKVFNDGNFGWKNLTLYKISP